MRSTRSASSIRGPCSPDGGKKGRPVSSRGERETGRGSRRVGLAFRLRLALGGKGEDAGPDLHPVLGQLALLPLRGGRGEGALIQTGGSEFCKQPVRLDTLFLAVIPYQRFNASYPTQLKIAPREAAPRGVRLSAMGHSTFVSRNPACYPRRSQEAVESHERQERAARRSTRRSPAAGRQDLEPRARSPDRPAPDDRSGRRPRVSARQAEALPRPGRRLERGTRGGRQEFRFLRESAKPRVAAPSRCGLAPAPRSGSRGRIPPRPNPSGITGAKSGQPGILSSQIKSLP
jgi:hypothetical protein